MGSWRADEVRRRKLKLAKEPSAEGVQVKLEAATRRQFARNVDAPTIKVKLQDSVQRGFAHDAIKNSFNQKLKYHLKWLGHATEWRIVDAPTIEVILEVSASGEPESFPQNS